MKAIVKSLKTNDTRGLYLAVPGGISSKLQWMPDQARNMGLHITGKAGSSKSRLMGRLIAFQDFLRGVPSVIFDPLGATIDNFLDKFFQLPQPLQEQLLPRIQYVDMSGRTGNIVPWPLYYRFGDESLFKISQRPLDVFRKLDPNLQTASIEGWNPLWRTGTYTGMLLSARNYQITEAEQLLRNPDRWNFNNLLEHNPELQPAVTFFRELGDASNQVRYRRTESFFNKIALFSLEPSMKAMFGAAEPGVNWDQVIRERKMVLLDFRHEHDVERRRFKMLWTFYNFLDFIKQRGPGRHIPISLIIDELTALFSVQVMTGDIFAAELGELINVIARNNMVWLTIAHQEMFQLPLQVQKNLMAMGTQIIGATTDRDTAVSMAHQFSRHDPHLVRKYEPVYMSDQGSAYIVDHRSIEYTIDEQLLLKSYAFTGLRRFEFLVIPVSREGDARERVRKITISGIDPGNYPDHKLLGTARDLLSKRQGQPVDKVLAEIEGRLKPIGQSDRNRKKKPKRGHPKPRASVWTK